MRSTGPSCKLHGRYVWSVPCLVLALRCQAAQLVLRSLPGASAGADTQRVAPRVDAVEANAASTEEVATQATGNEVVVAAEETDGAELHCDARACLAEAEVVAATNDVPAGASFGATATSSSAKSTAQGSEVADGEAVAAPAVAEEDMAGFGLHCDARDCLSEAEVVAAPKDVPPGASFCAAATSSSAACHIDSTFIE